jgi:DNA repair exonuclease SbcCD ATPase subunit
MQNSKTPQKQSATTHVESTPSTTTQQPTTQPKKGIRRRPVSPVFTPNDELNTKPSQPTESIEPTKPTKFVTLEDPQTSPKSKETQKSQTVPKPKSTVTVTTPKQKTEPKNPQVFPKTTLEPYKQHILETFELAKAQKLEETQEIQEHEEPEEITGPVITKIYHIADIHIKTGLREDIEHAFFELSERIHNEQDINRNHMSALVIAGDVFEKKTQVSGPDMTCFNTIMKYLEQNMIFTIIIPGNHDYDTMYNRSDLISPLMNGQYKYIKYYKMNGINHHFGIDFYIMAPLDKMIPKLVMPTKKGAPRVAIIHEPIEGALNFPSVEKPKFKINDLEKFDLVLLGDIHTHIFMGCAKTIAYPGSLVQVSKNEMLTHGYILWDVRKRIGQFHTIPLRSAHLAFTLSNDELTPALESLDIEEAKSLEITVINSSENALKSCKATIKEKFNSNKLIAIKRPCLEQSEQTINGVPIQINEDMLDLSSLQNQLELINKRLNIVLANRSEADGNIIRHNVLELHKISTIDGTRKKTAWKLKYLYWNNAISYGTGNYINFENMRGIIPIIGRNKIGKTAIIDILKIILYSTYDRGGLTNIRNRNRNSLTIQCGFIHENVEYTLKIDMIGDAATHYQMYRGTDHIDFYKKAGDFKDAVEYLIGDLEDFDGILVKSDNGVSMVHKSTVANLLNRFERYLDLDIFEKIVSAKSKILKQLKKEREHLHISPILKISDLQILIDDLSAKMKEEQTEISNIKAQLGKIEVMRHKILINPKVIGKSLTELRKMQNSTKDPQYELPDNRSDEELIKSTQARRTKIKDFAEKIRDYEKLLEIPSDTNGQIPAESLEQLVGRRNKFQTDLDTIFKSQKTFTKFTLKELRTMVCEYADVSHLTVGEIERDIKKLGDINDLRIIGISDEIINDIQNIDEYTNTINELKCKIKDVDIERLETDLELVKSKCKNIQFDEQCVCCENNKSEIKNITGEQTIADLIKKGTVVQKNNKKFLTEIKKLDEVVKNLEAARTQIAINEKILEKNGLNEQLKRVKLYEMYKNDLDNNRHALLTHNIKSINRKIEILKNNDIIHKNKPIIAKISHLSDKKTFEEDQLTRESNHLEHLITARRYISRDEINLAIRDIDRIDELISEKTTLSKKLEDINESLVTDKIAHKKLISDKNERQRVDDRLKTLDLEIENLSMYIDVIGINGVPFDILNIFLKQIEKIANIMLENFSEFALSVRIVNYRKGKDTDIMEKKIEINIIDANCPEGYPAVSGSGFQKFVTDLVLRLSIRKYIGKFPKFMIIDEGFGCLDADNLDHIKEMLIKLMSDPALSGLDFMMIISHSESIESLSNDRIKIEPELIGDHTFSICHYGDKPIVNISKCTSADVASVPKVKKIVAPKKSTSKSASVQLITHPDYPAFVIKDNKQYCTICDWISIKPKTLEQLKIHYNTDKHLRNKTDGDRKLVAVQSNSATPKSNVTTPMSDQPPKKLLIIGSHNPVPVREPYPEEPEYEAPAQLKIAYRKEKKRIDDKFDGEYLKWLETL